MSCQKKIFLVGKSKSFMYMGHELGKHAVICYIIII